jgi:hypothetical protein
MANAKAYFLLPTKDNDGRDLTSEIEQVRMELWMRFFAFTKEGEVEGVFKMSDGSLAFDVNEKYAVIIDEAAINELEEILREFKKRTWQEKIYLEIQHNVDFRLI